MNRDNAAAIPILRTRQNAKVIHIRRRKSSTSPVTRSWNDNKDGSVERSLIGAAAILMVCRRKASMTARADINMKATAATRKELAVASNVALPRRSIPGLPCYGFVERRFNRIEARRQFDGLIGVAAWEIQFALVIFHFHLNEFQAVGGGDH